MPWTRSSSSMPARRASSSRSSASTAATSSSRLVKGQIDGIGVAPRLARQGRGRRRRWSTSTYAPDAMSRPARRDRDVRATGSRTLAELRPRRDRPPRRAWRAGLRPPGADRRRRCSRGLERYMSLAPLHQPNNLAPIRLVMRDRSRPAAGRLLRHRLSSRPRRASPTTMPFRERFYAEGVRRYGFHGLSYEYVAERLREVAPDDRGRTRDRRASRQRRVDVRAVERARASKARWASPRSMACRWARGPASSIPASCSTCIDREGHERRRGLRTCSTSECGPQGPVRHQQRHARPAGQRRSASAALRHRPLRLPHRA